MDAVDEVVIFLRSLTPVREVHVGSLVRLLDELLVGVCHPVAVPVGQHVDNDAVLAHGLSDLLEHFRIPRPVGGAIGAKAEHYELSQRPSIRHLLQDRQGRDVVPTLRCIDGRSWELLLQHFGGRQHNGVANHADLVAARHLALRDRDLTAVLRDRRGGFRRFLISLLQSLGLFLQIRFQARFRGRGDQPAGSQRPHKDDSESGTEFAHHATTKPAPDRLAVTVTAERRFDVVKRPLRDHGSKHHSHDADQPLGRPRCQNWKGHHDRPMPQVDREGAMPQPTEHTDVHPFVDGVIATRQAHNHQGCQQAGNNQPTAVSECAFRMHGHHHRHEPHKS